MICRYVNQKVCHESQCKAVYLALVFLLTSSSLAIESTRSTTNISERYCALTVSPSLMNVSIPAGWTHEEIIYVEASSPGNAGLDVALSGVGEIKDWISLEAYYLNLSSHEGRNLTVYVNVPANASLGLHEGAVWLVSSDGQQAFVNLTANVSRGLGRINLTAKNTIGDPVWGATVFLWKDAYLNDSGSTNESGGWVSRWVYAGAYTLEVSKSGYKLESRLVEVLAGRTTQVNVTLEPSAGPVLDVSPKSISASAYVEETVTRTLTVMNVGDMLLDNITLSSDAGWISFSSAFIDYIDPRSYSDIDVRLGPQSEGGYYGNISVASANDGSSIVPVVFQVVARPPAGGIGLPLEEVIPETEETGTITSIPAGGTGQIRFSDPEKTGGVEGIAITARKYVSDVRITVETLATDLLYVYRYIRINTENIGDADISHVKIKFRVEKSWFTENDYDMNTVTLDRYRKDWQKLPTKLLSEDSMYVYYEATSPGLSLFVVTAEPKKREIEVIEYPEEINATQGGKLLFSVIVKNTGSTPLEHVTVSLWGAISDIEVFPSVVDELSPGSKSIFIVEAGIPVRLEPREYNVTIRAISDYITAKKGMRLRVSERPELMEDIQKGQLMSDIEALQTGVNLVWDETVERGLEGKNVTTVFSMLKKARDYMNLAWDYIEKKDYDRAKELTDSGKDYLEASVVGLSILVPREETVAGVTVPRPEYALLTRYKALIIFFLLTLLTLVYDRYRLKKTFKGVEERSELDRLRALFGRHPTAGMTQKPTWKGVDKRKHTDDMHDISIIKKRLGE